MSFQAYYMNQVCMEESSFSTVWNKSHNYKHIILMFRTLLTHITILSIRGVSAQQFSSLIAEMFVS